MINLGPSIVLSRVKVVRHLSYCLLDFREKTIHAVQDRVSATLGQDLCGGLVEVSSPSYAQVIDLDEFERKRLISSGKHDSRNTITSDHIIIL